MFIEIINTGSEILRGRVTNTLQQWLCQRLTENGFSVARQVTVPDAGEAIQEAVKEALERSDWVITTGGLGPTSDDLTRERIAQLLKRPLREDPDVLRHLSEFFQSRGRAMPPSTAVQALIPEGAIVLPNARGTAPGLLLQVPGFRARSKGSVAWLAMLPGPPRELQPMFTSQVLPRIQEQADPAAEFASQTFRVTGLGESQVEERLRAALDDWSGLEVGYCSRPGEVDVWVVARGPGASKKVAAVGQLIRERLGKNIYSDADETLEQVVVVGLRQRGLTLAVAESCTGGHLADRITNVPGASQVFLEGRVTYTNQAKERELGVRAATLAAHGAVSEPVAREMAEGIRHLAGADYGLGVTGIAGPTGGTEAKPVGTVFIALASARRTQVLRPLNRFDRETFKHVTSQQALELLRLRLAGEDA